MRRVLVPLDGTELATSILPDAAHLAGPDGQLILIHDATVRSFFQGTNGESPQVAAVEESDDYLEAVARGLREDGVGVEEHTVVLGAAAHAIDEAAMIFKADMIAAATHGRSLIERLWRGSVAWRALSHSPVPVLLRHGDEVPRTTSLATPTKKHILVPLDGSVLAERALPLAQQLATEWNAAISLIQVVSGSPGSGIGIYYNGKEESRSAHAYLQRIAGQLPDVGQVGVATGPMVGAISAVAAKWSITDIVMASHGRSGLARVMLGSVADALIQHLHLPIVVIPAFAAVRKAEPVQVGDAAVV